MRVLHLITTLDVGGAEMHLLAQVRGQCARGHAVRVAWLKGDGRLADDFRGAGAERVHRVPLARALAFGLADDLRWAEIVHSHLLKADALAALVAPLTGRRAGLVASKHNDERALLSPVVSRVHGLLGRAARTTIVLSDHVGRFVAEHGRVPLARQRRIYYGLDPTPFEAAARMDPERRARLRRELGFGADDVVFTCVARFAPQKAHDVLLDALALARKEAPAGSPELRLLLVGDDPFGDGRTRAQAQATKLALGASACFAGIRRDVPELLGASDVFAMTSLWEGLGLVFLEAMAARLPVLATRVSAVPEVVVDGETGVLVPPRDVPATARAMRELADDPERRRRMGEAGHARVIERFGLDRMIEETLDVYRKVLTHR